MIAIVSPTARRVAATAAIPSSSRARVHPDLQGPEALLAKTQRGLRASCRRQQRPARRVGGDAVRRASEHRRDRHALDLAGDVPERDLERPVPPGVEVDRLEDANVAGDRERVLADEQVLEGREPVHRVARADAHDALVGLDADDRRRERSSRNGIPGRVERRIERLDEAIEPDRGDLHVMIMNGRRGHRGQYRPTLPEA